MEGVEGEDLFSILPKQPNGDVAINNQTENKEETREDAGGDHKSLGRHNEVEARERGQRRVCPKASCRGIYTRLRLLLLRPRRVLQSNLNHA